jgi:hypothetical protein
MNKLYLDINVPDLENFDFEQPLTNSMKEQLVIYNLFVEQFLWLSYLNNLFFKSSIASIAEKLKIGNRSCSFAKQYNILLMKGCSDVFYFFCDNYINIINLHEMCLIQLQNGRFYYVQKDFLSKKDRNPSFYLISDYYKKRLFKIYNDLSEFISNLKREIHFILRNPKSIEFSGCAVSVEVFYYLANLCLFTVLHNIRLLPDRTCNDVKTIQFQ